MTMILIIIVTMACIGPPESCPTEELSCQFDPECLVRLCLLSYLAMQLCDSTNHVCVFSCHQTSPSYQEPDGTLLPGVIVGACVVAALIVIAVLYAVHLFMLKRQARCYCEKFASHVAETSNLTPSRRTLTPDMLAAEFA